jgi:hypothetical protein
MYSEKAKKPRQPNSLDYNFPSNFLIFPDFWTRCHIGRNLNWNSTFWVTKMELPLCKVVARAPIEIGRFADRKKIPEALPVVRATKYTGPAPEPWKNFFLAIFNSGRCSMPQNDPAKCLKWKPKEKTSFSQPNQLDLAPKNGTKSTFFNCSLIFEHFFDPIKSLKFSPLVIHLFKESKFAFMFDK